jgi:hypothetical protein
VRETENLVRKASKAQGSESHQAPQPPVMSEVLRTKSVRVRLHERGNGTARIVIDVTDPKRKTGILRAIEAALSK